MPAVWQNADPQLPRPMDLLPCCLPHSDYSLPPSAARSEMEGKKSVPQATAPKAEDLASSPNAELLSIFKELADHFFQHGEDNSG